MLSIRASINETKLLIHRFKQRDALLVLYLISISPVSLYISHSTFPPIACKFQDWGCVELRTDLPLNDRWLIRLRRLCGD